MLGTISVPEATLLIGLPATILAAYLGWSGASRQRVREIAEAPSSAIRAPAVILDSSIGDRIAGSLEQIASHMKSSLEAADRRDEEQRREEDRKIMQAILDELRKGR